MQKNYFSKNKLRLINYIFQLYKNTQFKQLRFLLLYFFFILVTYNVQGQACISANWGVDAGLYSGVMEYGGLSEPSSPRSNDWFLGTAGIGIIDETNTASLQTLLQAGGNPLYENRLKYYGNSAIDNQLYIDAVFARDYFGGTGFMDASSYITASKNGEDPAIWDPGESNVLGKNDIIDAAGFMMRDGTTLDGHLYFIGLFNMAEPGGTAYMDFEFYVNSVSYTTGSGFTSGGPQLGHTAYNFDTPGNITKVGDFIFSVSLDNSGALVETRIWVSRAEWDRLGGSISATLPTFQWAGTFDGAFNGSPYGYAGILPLNSDNVCGIVNPDETSPLAPPWGTKGTKTNTYSSNYIPNSVSEVGIDLTAMGMDHSSLAGVDKCYFPLNTFLVKTRASASFTAQLKDFAGPYSWGTPSFNAVALPEMISCDTPTAVISASPQRGDVTYNWSTVDGSFIPGAHPWEIIASKAGTYDVEVLFSTGCPAQIVSTTVINDPTKPFFNGPPTATSTTACNGSDGTITATASGATKPYTFKLYDSSNTEIASALKGATESSHTFTGLAPGTYTVDVKGVYACIVSTEIIVPAKIPVVSAPLVTNVLCNGATTGAINLTVSGGKTPLTYLWSTGNTSKDLLNVGAGDYTITITDAAGCITTGSYTITQPTALSASIAKTNDTNADPILGTGTATLTVTGGTGAYTYAWVALETGTVPSGQATNKDLTELDYGSYTVTITDANLCTTTATVFIYEPEVCDDGIDNDGDGLNNCDDSDCKPATTSNITAGNPTICVTQTTTYSVTADAAYDSYVWTVPASATINGSATGNSISVTWNSTAGGQICVSGKKYDCISDAVCISVNVAAVPPKPGTIIITN